MEPAGLKEAIERALMPTRVEVVRAKSLVLDMLVGGAVIAMGPHCRMPLRALTEWRPLNGVRECRRSTLGDREIVEIDGRNGFTHFYDWTLNPPLDEADNE